jgi:hypothetical protein
MSTQVFKKILQIYELFVQDPTVFKKFPMLASPRLYLDIFFQIYGVQWIWQLPAALAQWVGYLTNDPMFAGSNPVTASTGIKLWKDRRTIAFLQVCNYARNFLCNWPKSGTMASIDKVFEQR